MKLYTGFVLRNFLMKICIVLIYYITYILKIVEYKYNL